MNRLNLDFSLESGEERSKFLHKYLINSKLQNLTPTELETISNYLLWGKDKDGLNCNQKKEIQIDKFISIIGGENTTIHWIIK